tara:strand:+ start:800 stop:907 length:108 start_codon:yes stop_codon:yes gene_type:complete
MQAQQAIEQYRSETRNAEQQNTAKAVIIKNTPLHQ